MLVRKYIWLLLLLPLCVHAAPTYAPGQVALTVKPGESRSFSYRLNAEGAYAVAPFMWYQDEGLPIAWLGSLQAKWHWFSSSGSQTVTLSIPADAAPGVYQGRLYGFVSGGAHAFQRGDGVAVTLNVESECAGAEFVAGSDNDFELWAPNHALRSVELFGELRLPSGCTIIEARYVIVDEYGQYSGSGELEITDDPMGYRAIPLVEVSRHGQDQDGREYTVTLSIETEAGITTHNRKIVVLHDRRDKADAKPAKANQ